MTKALINLSFYLAFLLAAGPSLALKFHGDLASIKLVALPGQVTNRTVRLTLEKDEVRTQFKVHVDDWWRSEDGKKSFYRPAGTISRSCATWTKINPIEASVEPGGNLDVRLTISVPTDVKPGGHWCVLTIDEVQDPKAVVPEGVGLRFLSSISVGIFVEVGPLTRAAKIIDPQIEESRLSVKIENDGNCPLGIDGRVEFLRPGEKTPAATVTFGRTTILPEPVNTGIMSAALPDEKVLPSGTYLVRVILDIGLDHYIGKQKEMQIRREVPHPSPASST
jgi:hypothetical protein